MDERDVSPPSVARVLIVDDHPDTASMLARVLRKLETSAEVLTAYSGEEALQLIGDQNIDVLITDFIMPGMSGLELIEKLKREDHEPGHVILMTAYDIPGLVMTSRQLKVQDYLVKPVDPEKIRGIVDKVLKQIYPEQSTDDDSASVAPPKILIADDNPDNIRLLAVRLKSEGYQFITAADGEETLQKVQEEKPDLVLLDVNMPNKDGFEVLTEMRANSEIAHLPVIVITAARIGIKDVREGLTLGADDYITKPFDWRELSARIRTKLRVKRAEDALRKRSKNLSVLPEISLDLGERLDVEGLTKSILGRTVGALEASNGYLIVFQPDGNLTFHAHEIDMNSPWMQEELRERWVAEGVVGEVVSSRQSKIVENTAKLEGWPESEEITEQAAIIVPMLGRRDVLGVMILVHQTAGYFKDEHLTLVQAIASQAALAVENAQLYASERKRVNELVALNSLIRNVNAFTRSSELAEELPFMMRDVFGYPAVGFWMIVQDGLELRTLAGEENAPRPSILEIAPQQAASTGQPARISGSIEERTGERAGVGEPPTQAAIAVPLPWKGKVRGVLSIHSQRAGIFQESDRVVLETLAAQITSAFERIQLFESVEKEQRRLSAVLRSAADAILVLDGEGRVQLVNPAGERLFTDVSVKVGQPLPEGRGYDNLIEVLENFNSESMEDKATEISWPDRRTFAVQITLIETGGKVAILHDVSHFKALDQIKNDFLATATHDLKNPIFAVLGYSDLLVKAGPLNDMQVDFVSRIRNSSVQMQDLVLNLLEVARMDMGTELKLETFDLNDVLFSVVQEFQPQAELRQHELKAQLDEQPLNVLGDRTRLMQVARNLLGNAIKYTPDGGAVTVRSNVQDGMAMAYFDDTGIGISEEDLTHLFEKFYRVQNEATQDIEGNGLGLAIVKAIIEQHHGKIQVDSEVNKGSCFSFNLPLVKETP